MADIACSYQTRGLTDKAKKHAIILQRDFTYTRDKAAELAGTITMPGLNGGPPAST